LAREEDAPFQDKFKIRTIVGIWTNGKLGRKQTLSFRQLLFQLRILFFSSADFFRLVWGHAALQGNVLVQLIMQRLLFL
jgi:hypothetical protein